MSMEGQEAQATQVVPDTRAQMSAAVRGDNEAADEAKVQRAAETKQAEVAKPAEPSVERPKQQADRVSARINHLEREKRRLEMELKAARQPQKQEQRIESQPTEDELQILAKLHPDKLLARYGIDAK